MQNITSFSEWTLFLPHDKDSVKKERIIVEKGALYVEIITLNRTS